MGYRLGRSGGRIDRFRAAAAVAVIGAQFRVVEAWDFASPDRESGHHGRTVLRYHRAGRASDARNGEGSAASQARPERDELLAGAVGGSAPIGIHSAGVLSFFT